MSVQNTATMQMIQNIIDGTTPPEHANNVTDSIGSHALTEIFEIDGTTVKEATSANDPNAVHFTEQTLTAEQQAQARTNIGAASKEALEEGLAGKQPKGDYALQNGSYPNMTVGNATNAENATSAETAEKVANALTVTVNGEKTEYDGSAAAAVTVSASNPNLLYNSNFAINQRGNSSYTSAGYTVDGWRKTSSSGTVYLNTGPFSPVDNCIYFSATSEVYLRQYLEKGLKRSTTYTITIGYHTSTSVYISYETSYTFTTPSGTSTTSTTWAPFTGYQVTIYPSGPLASRHAYVQFGCTSSSGTTYYFHYIKLEEGSVATPYEFPNPAEELLKCQRYYVKYSEDFQIAGTVSGTANTAYVTMFLPATMRTIPTIVSWNGSGIRLNGSSYSTVDDIDVYGCENNKFYLKIHTSADYPDMAICVWFGKSLELSAELTS